MHVMSIYILVGASGLEPPTPTMSRWCSNQLSYAPKINSRGRYHESQHNSSLRLKFCYQTRTIEQIFIITSTFRAITPHYLDQAVNKIIAFEHDVLTPLINSTVSDAATKRRLIV